MIKRRIEMTVTERQRIVAAASVAFCPACRVSTVFLTTSQAALFAQVKTQSIRRWLARGKAHGVKTCGGQHRVCKNSLFQNYFALIEGA